MEHTFERLKTKYWISCAVLYKEKVLKMISYLDTFFPISVLNINNDQAQRASDMNEKSASDFFLGCEIETRSFYDTILLL